MQHLLSKIPKIDKIIEHPSLAHCNKKLLKKITQKILASIRQKILDKKINYPPPLEEIIKDIAQHYKTLTTPSLKPIINATGVVLQTNLGRSIFSPALIKKILPLLREYSNLEFDLQKGARSERYMHICKIICMIFNCEDAIVVNNNAAAVMLIINTFAKNKEAIVSRGELVEIGGNFRIHEVIKQSGAKLIEVGTTNKTHLSDYEDAISQDTTMILKIHQSNFAQVGFVSQVDIQHIHHLAKKNHLIDYYDVGSGYITGIKCHEPSLLEIAKLSPSLVSFSGDKLFGGPQAGIIFGKKNLIDKLKKNHLLRALRIDKLSLIFLQETLLYYLNHSLDKIPSIAMLNQSQEILLNKAQKLIENLAHLSKIHTEILPIISKAGGGSLPNMDFNSYGVSIKHHFYHAQIFCKKLRIEGLVTRIKNNAILLDMRCIETRHFKKIVTILENLEFKK